VQLVDKRPKLGWVRVAHLFMSKKLFIYFVSFCSDPWVASRIFGRLGLLTFLVFCRPESFDDVGCGRYVSIGIVITLIGQLLDRKFASVWVVLP
jgi:hypothetical protein